MFDIRDQIYLIESLTYVALLTEEARIDFLNKTYGEKLTAKFDAERSSEPHGVVSEVDEEPGESSGAKVLSYLVSFDPTRNHAYSQWMVVRYLKGQMRLEDGPRARQYLEVFDRAKHRLANRDINSYRSLPDVLAAIRPYMEDAEQIAKVFKNDARVENRMRQEDQATIHYDGPDMMIVTPHTIPASRFWGSNTEWCTTWKPPRQCQFDYYNGRGPLFIVILRPSGEKYQLHFETRQFMDKDDRPIKLGPFIAQYPRILKVIGEERFLPMMADLGLRFFSPRALAKADDRTLVAACHTQEDFALIPASKKAEPKFIDELLYRDASRLEWLPRELYEPRLEEMVKENPATLRHLPKDLQSTELAKTLLVRRGHSAGWRFIDQSIPRDLWDDEIERAYWNSYSGEGRPELEKVPEKYRTPEVVENALVAHPEHIPRFADLLNDELALRIAKRNVNAIQYLPESYLDKAMVDILMAKAAQHSESYQRSTYYKFLLRFNPALWPLEASDTLIHYRMAWAEMPRQYRSSPDCMLKFLKMNSAEAGNIERHYLTKDILRKTLYDIAKHVDPDLLTDDVIVPVIHDSDMNYYPGRLYKDLPQSAKTPAVMAAFVEKAVVPISEIPPSLVTEKNVVRRAGMNIGEVSDIPDRLMSPKLAQELTRENWQAARYLPERVLTGDVLVTFLHGYAHAHWGEGAKIAKECYARFPTKVMTSKTVAEALRKGLMDPVIADVPASLLDETICGIIVARTVREDRTGQLDAVPEKFRTDAMFATAVEINPDVLKHIPREGMSEPVLHAAMTHASSSYLQKHLTDLPRENWSKRVYEEAVGYLVPLSEVPRNFRSVKLVNNAIRRDATSVVALRDPAKWMNENAKTFEHQTDQWQKKLESSGVLITKKGFQNVTDLPREQVEGGSVAVVSLGKVNRKLFVFNKRGKLVFDMYTNKGKVFAPQTERGMAIRPLLIEVAKKYLSGLDLNDLNDIGIYSEYRGQVYTEDAKRQDFDGLTWSKVSHRNGYRHTLWIGKDAALRITEGRSGSGWSSRYGIQNIEVLNAGPLIPLAPKIAHYLNRKIGGNGGDWRLRDIGIIAKRGGEYIAVADQKMGETEGYTVWLSKATDDREYLSIFSKEHMLGYARIKKDGSLTEPDLHYSHRGDQDIRRAFSNMEQVLRNARKKKKARA